MPDPQTLHEELEHRLTMWALLKENGGTEKATPDDLRALKAFGGAQGIWVDKKRTQSLTPDGDGIAVALLNTSSKYQDESSDDGVVYHYPDTDRPASRDSGEINALKAAAESRIPVFVIDRVTPSSKFRNVRLGWVMSCDDLNRVAWVEYADEAPPPLTAPTDDAPFDLDSPDSEQTKNISSRRNRPGQAKFNFQVFKRYGAQCPFSGIAVREVLDAAHVKSKAQGGSDDPRNGLVLASHIHRAWDASLFGINPKTLIAEDRAGGDILRKLSIAPEALAEQQFLPHRTALLWKWECWTETNLPTQPPPQNLEQAHPVMPR